MPRLPDIFPHYNLRPLHERRYFVSEMITARTQACIAIQEARKRPEKKASTSTATREPAIKLTPEEEALCKLLGLSKRQLIELRRNHNATT